MKELRVSEDLLEAVISHARQCAPHEACGLLGGRDNGAEKAYRLRNVHASPVSYAFDSREQLEAMKQIERDSLELVGIYHSHPASPAIPSSTDIERAFFPGTREPNFPGVFYVIVSLSGTRPEVNAFLIHGHCVEKAALKTH
jgi:proteasome lid subunit RPN8/RPN11